MSQPGPQDGPSATPQAVLPVLSYATPYGYEPGIWRFGAHVIVSDDADLPNRCVRCNRPADGLIMVRECPGRGPVHVGLCRRHRDIWWLWRIAGLICTTVGTFVFILLGAAFCVEAKSSGSEPMAAGIFDAVFCLVLLSGPFFLLGLIISRVLKPMGHMVREGSTLFLWPSGQAFRNSLRKLDTEPETPSLSGDP